MHEESYQLLALSCLASGQHNLDLHSGERGQQGFHIHEVGRCDAPEFQSAGSHYNPTGEDHGLLAPDGAHAGDLPNLWIEADESADYALTTDLVI